MTRAAPTQCVVLVGGLGTRLGALTKSSPKPLTAVGDRPFLAYLLWHVRRFGFRKVLLLAGHLGQAVADFAADPRWTEGLDVSVVVEPEPLGTGGALKFGLPHFDERFLLLNGDSLFDFNWLDLVDLKRRHDPAQVCMALRREADATRFGVVSTEGERVISFAERGDASGGEINGGVYLLDRVLVGGLPERCSFERDVLPRLAIEGRIAAALQTDFFIDIGVPESLSAAPTSVPASLRRGAVFFDRDGVLNVDDGYTHRIDQLEWTAGAAAAAAVKTVNDRNLFAFVVTNQAGVARGYYDEDAVEVFHRAMQERLRAMGAHVDDFRFCPHHPEGVDGAYAVECDYRKPRPGMLHQLMAAWPVDVAASALIGDKPSDVEAAEAAGVTGRLLTAQRVNEAVESVLEARRAARAPARV